MTATALTLDDASALSARARLLRTSVVAIFLLFFQTYMVAPLIPSLADAWHIDRQRVGLLIPAYTIPYAVAGLICGALSDRLGRRGIYFFSLVAFPIVSLAMALAPNFNALIGLRLVSGATNVGMVVIALAMMGDLFPPNERGRAIGWIFGAIAGGGAFGSTLGGLLTPIIGWRGLFVLVAIAGAVVLGFAMPLWQELAEASPIAQSQGVGAIIDGYAAILRSTRAAKTYLYIFANAVFHSGVFTWLGVLLHDRYGLGDAGIGLALLGYGVPGLFLGPTIGRIVDKRGRRKLIPIGLLIAAGTALVLALHVPLAITAIAITLLSLGFDMTHPLFAGIVTTLDENRRGQAMGLNAFSIFFGLGVGSLIFGYLTKFGMSNALLAFAVAQASIGLLALSVFRSE